MQKHWQGELCREKSREKSREENQEKNREESSKQSGQGERITQRATFEARDPSPVDYVTNRDGTQRYTGPERRKINRRSGSDRRNEVRFDLNSRDRRQNPGRRKDDKTPSFW